jgi:hypothetical protein
VRILKIGNKIRMESNGIQCLAFDDGETYGPVYGEGYIGHATLHDLQVFEADQK